MPPDFGSGHVTWQTGPSAKRFRFTPEPSALAGRVGVDGDPATTFIERDRAHMKNGIHPEYTTTEVICSCGSTFTTRSTAKGGEIRVETCSACHPFYTGKQRVMDTAGRVAKFQAKYAKVNAANAAKKK
jgi:large subunit ribosomal protein L31